MFSLAKPSEMARSAMISPSQIIDLDELIIFKKKITSKWLQKHEICLKYVQKSRLHTFSHKIFHLLRFLTFSHRSVKKNFTASCSTVCCIFCKQFRLTGKSKKMTLPMKNTKKWWFLQFFKDKLIFSTSPDAKLAVKRCGKQFCTML